MFTTWPAAHDDILVGAACVSDELKDGAGGASKAAVGPLGPKIQQTPCHLSRGGASNSVDLDSLGCLLHLEPKWPRIMSSRLL